MVSGLIKTEDPAIAGGPALQHPAKTRQGLADERETGKIEKTQQNKQRRRGYLAWERSAQAKDLHGMSEGGVNLLLAHSATNSSN